MNRKTSKRLLSVVAKLEKLSEEIVQDRRGLSDPKKRVMNVPVAEMIQGAHKTALEKLTSAFSEYVKLFEAVGHMNNLGPKATKQAKIRAQVAKKLQEKVTGQLSNFMAGVLKK